MSVDSVQPDPRDDASMSRVPRASGSTLSADDRPRSISSDSLFANGATEVQIAHRGAIYRLKQTALGKLILTK